MELSPDEVREFGAIVRNNSSSLGNLLNELFELAKLERREIAPTIEPFSIDQLVDDLIVSHSATASARELTIQGELPEDLPLVLGDVRLIERVLNNLIGNSLRYTPAGGRVWVRVTPGTSQVSVEVVDTGIGIPVDEFTNMFDRFQTGTAAPLRAR